MPEQQLIAWIVAKQVVQQLQAILHNYPAICATLLPAMRAHHPTLDISCVLHSSFNNKDDKRMPHC